MKKLIATAIAALTLTAQAQDAELRYVSGSGVNLRNEPSLRGTVLARLALDESVKLVAQADGGVFCEVLRRTVDGREQRGFTACVFLLTEADHLSQLAQRPLGEPSPVRDSDPKRDFWLSPSWPALEAYGQWLSAKRLAAQPQNLPYEERAVPLRAADVEFDRMKAHMAKGMRGPAPQPYLAWETVQREAQTLTPVLDPRVRSDSKYPTGNAATPEEMRRYDEFLNRGSSLSAKVALWGPLFDGRDSAGQGGMRAAALVGAIALPTVEVSLFASERDVSLSERTESLSGRFDIVHLYKTHPRLPRDPNTGDVGLVDISAYTVSLVKPVARTTLFRDGRQISVSTHAAQRRSLWEFEEPMCHDHVSGFSHGDSLPRLWDSEVGDYRESLKRNAKGSLVSIMTRQSLATTTTRPLVQPVRLDRTATGFVSATQWTFDLDSDGVPDLAVWEGVGQGPGHLGGPTTSDDPWHRLFFVNIAGRWHLLGYDVFSYGCGC
jgi:hypothetical protein